MLSLFEAIAQINEKPVLFSASTIRPMWTDPYISKQMLALHLDEKTDLASKKPRFIDQAAAFIADRFQPGPGTRVCDFGCGPGLYTRRFAQTGARVTGVDFSKSSLDYARTTAARNRQDITYIYSDYLEFTPAEPFDLITLIFYDFCALSPRQRRRLFQGFRRCLKADGRLFIDGISTVYFDSATEARTYEYHAKNGFWSGGPHYVFQNTFTYEPEKVILKKHTVVESDRTRTFFNWLSCFDRESLEAECLENGFRIEQWYGDVTGAPYRPDEIDFAFVAEMQ